MHAEDRHDLRRASQQPSTPILLLGGFDPFACPSPIALVIVATVQVPNAVHVPDG
jgi:hypothetical protein